MRGDLYLPKDPPRARRSRRVRLSSAVYAVALAFALGVAAGILYTRRIYEPLLEDRAAEARYHRVASGAPVAPVWLDAAD